MKAVTFITMFLLCVSCRTVRHTTETKRDTTTTNRNIAFPYDTTLIRYGAAPITWNTPITVDTGRWWISVPDTAMSYDGVILKYGIDSAGLHQTLSRKNDTISLRDTFYVQGTDTLIREHTIMTEHPEETWYEKLWRQAKDFIIIALILIVIIKLVFK